MSINAKQNTGILLAAFLIGSLIFAGMQPVFSQSSSKKEEDDLKMRQYMFEISGQLGVTCQYCHDVNNFRSSQKLPFKIAKDHMRVTQMLNERGFKGKPAVTCYMCHKGTAKPDYLPPKNYFTDDSLE